MLTQREFDNFNSFDSTIQCNKLIIMSRKKDWQRGAKLFLVIYWECLQEIHYLFQYKK